MAAPTGVVNAMDRDAFVNHAAVLPGDEDFPPYQAREFRDAIARRAWRVTPLTSPQEHPPGSAVRRSVFIPVDQEDAHGAALDVEWRFGVAAICAATRPHSCTSTRRRRS